MRIAFLGLGNMGAGMAANLVKGGHEVTGFDPAPAARQRASELQVRAVETLADAVKGADAAVSMLPAGAHVREAYENGVFAAANPGALFIDCSTIDVASARAVAEAARAKGFAMVDAPVSGGIMAANAGSLTFMVGGSAQDFARAEPVLAKMGRAVIHAGEAGAGQAAKICNNMILGVTMIGTCEAFLLAQKLGLDTQKFFDIASKASGQSWSMTSYCPVPGPVEGAPSNRNYEGGFLTELMWKDLKLAHDEAQRAGLSSPLGAAAEALYALFDANGGHGRDFSGIIKMLGGEKL
ncbi:MAG: 3-hydroxyisobutyrate dehydrogenase [Hyphomonadaceae bacterium]